MSVNEMGFEQAASILTALAAEATGDTNVQAVQDLSSYISVGQSVLNVGYDPLNIGLSQLVSDTLFSFRPYEGELSSLDRNADQWGAIMRKINAIQQPVKDSGVYNIEDGAQTVSMFDVRKPKLWQTNFTGFDVWSDNVTITRQQLKNALQNPSDMGRLFDLILGTKANEMELSRELFRRATLANFIGALKAIGNATQVRHLLTEYNAATGGSYTAATVRAPGVYEHFIRWAYAEIAKASDNLTAYTSAYHLNPSVGKILRHTPVTEQRFYVYSGALHDVDANVLSVTYHDNDVANKLPAITERVKFFQTLSAPDSIKVKPAYIDVDGAVVTSPEAQTVENIFGLLCDRAAIGVNFYDQSVDVSPYEAAHKYYNYWYHDAHRYYNDVTENAILFLLD